MNLPQMKSFSKLLKIKKRLNLKMQYMKNPHYIFTNLECLMSSALKQRIKLDRVSVFFH